MSGARHDDLSMQGRAAAAIGLAPVADLRRINSAYGWDSDRLDLEAYVHRIGYDGLLEPTYPTLVGLMRAHLKTIPFENVTVWLGDLPSLDLAHLQDKLVRSRRGGYCFEHNLLFAAVLDRCGFDVTGLNARMLAGKDEDALPGMGHTVLQVEVEGRSYAVDVGAGGYAPIEPMDLDVDTDVTHADGGVYQLKRTADGMWMLRQRTFNGWFNIYKFSLAPSFRVDYEDDNRSVVTDPRSPFTRMLVAQRHGHDVRHSLVGLEHRITRPGHESSVRELRPDELPDVLDHVFGIGLEVEQQRELVRIAAPGSEEELMAVSRDG